MTKPNTPVIRHFRDGHTECWWTADAVLAGWGPDRPTRLVVATTDPASLPAKTTWYLTTDLPRPGGPREADSPHRAVDYAEIVRVYGLRIWVEQSYKQIKDELGWADFQVRSDVAIRRHQVLVNCAFSFCWQAWFTDAAPPDAPVPGPRVGAGERGSRTRRGARSTVVAQGDPRGPRLAQSLDHAAALLAGLDRCAPTR